METVPGLVQLRSKTGTVGPAVFLTSDLAGGVTGGISMAEGEYRPI